MPGAFKPPAPQSACAVYVRTRPRRGLAGVFAFVCREDASYPRMSVGYESRIYRPSMSQMGQTRRLSCRGMSAPPDFGRMVATQRTDATGQQRK